MNSIIKIVVFSWLSLATISYADEHDKELTSISNAINNGNYKLASEMLTPSALAGNAQSQYLLGLVKSWQDKPKEAVYWLVEASNQNHDDAQYELALMYSDGYGVIKNTSMAVKLLKSSANNGNVDAQYELGVYFFEGEILTQNYDEAVRLWKTAAEAGDLDAQTNLGLMHLNGFGVSQNNLFAYMWIYLAAQSGHQNAIENLKIISELLNETEKKLGNLLAVNCMSLNLKGCENLLNRELLSND